MKIRKCIKQDPLDLAFKKHKQFELELRKSRHNFDESGSFVKIEIHQITDPSNFVFTLCKDKNKQLIRGSLRNAR